MADAGREYDVDYFGVEWGGESIRNRDSLRMVSAQCAPLVWFQEELWGAAQRGFGRPISVRQVHLTSTTP